MIGAKGLLESALARLSPNDLNVVLARSGIQYQISAQWYGYDGSNLVAESGACLPPGAGLTQVTAVRVLPMAVEAPKEAPKEAPNLLEQEARSLPQDPKSIQPDVAEISKDDAAKDEDDEDDDERDDLKEEDLKL